MPESVLICTVGGSHQPIIKAINDTKPDFVCFICTGPVPETGNKGSETQITGKGPVVAEKSGLPPTLPNIPTQLGMRHESFELWIVPADDLDEAFVRITEKLRELKEKYPGAKFISDYTGGTKSMTAALVTAVLETDDVGLQLITGTRADLVKIAEDTEYAINANVDRIRLERAMRPYVSAWARYA